MDYASRPFSAQRWSTCANCGRPIEPGDEVHSVGHNAFAHVKCEVVGPAPTTSAGPKVKSKYAGMVATSGTGEVLAVMSDEGEWCEVDALTNVSDDGDVSISELGKRVLAITERDGKQGL